MWSEYTDVYVALDYPPSEEYRAGWVLVCNYLECKVESHSFRKLIVVKRDRNYGVRFPDGNFSMMISTLRNMYESYIVSEDDNVFSKNFLLYINKGLRKFKDDDRIALICGYNYPMEFPDSYKNNFYISKHLSSWGYATWFKKEEAMYKYFDLRYLKAVLHNKERYQKLIQHRPSTVYSIIRMIKNNKIYGDSAIGCYLCLEDKYCVFPTISKVKNFGSDGTGVNSREMYVNLYEFYSNQILDDEDQYDFSNDIFTYEPVMLVRHRSPGNLFKEAYKKITGKIDLFLFRNFNFVPKTKYI